MKRWRFFASQLIWVIAMIVAGIAGSEGDGGIIPFVLLFSFVLTGFTLKWGAKGENASEDSVMGYKGHVIVRVMATALIWITYMGGSVASVMEMAGWGVLLAVVLMIPAIVFTGLLWSWERISGIADRQMQSVAEHSEKRKRRSMYKLLNDLSDDDLAHLRNRLTEDKMEDELRYEHTVSDDGELVYRH